MRVWAGFLPWLPERCDMTSSNYPIDLYRCVACGYEGLAQTQDRVYCSQCGQPYPLLHSQAVDFISPFSGSRLSTIASGQGMDHLPGLGWKHEQIWHSWVLSMLTGESFDAERERHLLQELIGDKDPVLAMGTAYWSQVLLRDDPDRTILGMDTTIGALEEAASQSRSTWSHYSLLRAQTDRMPLRAASLGGVMLGLTSIVQKPTLQEIGRVLQPRGILVSLHGQKSLGWEGMLQPVLSALGVPIYSRSEWQVALQSVGLEIDRYLSFGTLAFTRAIRVETSPNERNS